MRTTLTIDDDVMVQLKQEARRRRMSLRDVVNDLLRRGLSGATEAKRKPFQVKVYDSRLRPGFDPTGFNKLADELEDDALVAKLNQGR